MLGLLLACAVLLELLPKESNAGVGLFETDPNLLDVIGGGDKGLKADGIVGVLSFNAPNEELTLGLLFSLTSLEVLLALCMVGIRGFNALGPAAYDPLIGVLDGLGAEESFDAFRLLSKDELVASIGDEDLALFFPNTKSSNAMGPSPLPLSASEPLNLH